MRSAILALFLFVASTLNAQNVTTIQIPGATSVELNVVGPHGMIVGNFSSASGLHYFLRDKNGHITVFDLDVNTPEGPAEEVEPIAMNDKGQIVGTAFPIMPSNQEIALYTFLRDVDGTITVFNLPNMDYSAPVGIDTNGDILGSSQDANGPPHGWVRTADGTLTRLIPTSDVVIPYAITPDGQIWGIYKDTNANWQTFEEKLHPGNGNAQ
jgi:hypothetical protein